MKQRIAICLIFAMLLTLLCACNGNQPGTQMSAEESSHGTEAVSDPAESSSPAESGESGVSEMEIAQTGWTEAVPASYTQAAAEQGAVVRLYYESEDYVRDSSPITKTAYVYTPYETNETYNEYNIFSYPIQYNIYRVIRLPGNRCCKPPCKKRKGYDCSDKDKKRQKILSDNTSR